MKVQPVPKTAPTQLPVLPVKDWTFQQLLKALQEKKA